MAVLRVHLFGGLSLGWDQTPLPSIPSTTARSLLAYLITYRNRPHTRDLLAGTFWPDLPESTARRRLSQALWHIRSSIAHPLAADLFFVEGDTVQINPGLSLWTDVAEFEQQAGGRQQDFSRAAGNLVLAVDLYRGDLLAGYYDDWLLVERERLRELLLAVLAHLVDGFKSQGNFEQALIYARRLAGEDPWREQAQREVMRLCHLLGRDAEALKQFEACCQALKEEFDASPEPETVALIQEIARQAGLDTAPYLPQAAPTPLRLVEADAGLTRTPLVGRQEERAALVSHLEAAIDGRGGLVLVEGEAGVGKTRLLQEIGRDAEWRGTTVLWGRGRELQAPAPYAPLVEALTGGLFPLRAGQLAGMVDRLWLQTLAPLLPQFVPLSGPSPAPQAGSAAQPERLGQAFARLLCAWGQIHPLLIVLEDLHWMDEDMLDLLADLAPRLREASVLILGTCRSGDARDRPRLWAQVQALDRAGLCGRLLLSRLDAATTGELIRRSLRLGAPAPLFEQRLFQETEGNPLFVLETLQALFDEGLLVRDTRGAWSTPWDAATHNYADLPLPSAVERVIARRLDHLSAAERSVLETGAVLGSDFDLPLLSLVLSATSASLARPSEFLPVLGVLVRRHLLEETAIAYRFAHDKIRSVAYRAMEAAGRQHCHRQAGVALERLHPDRFSELAHHFFEGQVWERAARYHRLAGERAAAVYANREAVQHDTLALEAMDHSAEKADPGQVFELRLAREAALARLGERVAQAGDLAALEELLANPALDTPARRLQLALRRAALGDACSDYPLALAAAEQAAQMAQRSGDLPAEGQARVQWGRLLRQRGELAAAREQFERAYRLAQARTDALAQALLLRELGVVCFEQGDYGQALEYLQAALEGYPAAGDPVELASIHNSLANLFHYLADFPAALEHDRRALALRRAVGDRRLEAMSLYNLSAVLHDSGDHAAARQTLEQVCALTQAIGDKRVEGYAWVYLGLVLEYQQEWEAARSAYHTGLALRREVGLHALAIDALSGLARVAAACADHAAAVRYAGEVLAWLEEHGPDGVGDPCLAYKGAYRALLAAGEIERGQAALRAAHALLMAYANSLADPDRRRAYLHDIEPGRTIWNDYRALVSRREQVRLPRTGAPTGRPLRDEEYVTVAWTVFAPEDEGIQGKAARRQAQLRRLLREAGEQRTAPTIDDLALALEVSRATIKRDLAALRQAGYEVKTRGNDK